MKLIAGIAVLAVMTGAACAQNPNIITNTKNKLATVQQQKTADSNAALRTSDGQSGKSPFHVSTTTGIRTAPVRSHVSVAAQPRPANFRAAAGPRVPARRLAKSQPAKQVIAVENTKIPPDSTQPPEQQPINLTGRRDPFVSPVVSRAITSSACSSGKRCLAIDQINLRGVVKSDDGMIAVVVNALDKAYFLHENDPVFNGYVVRITGDSVIFRETVQDKFGKPFTRDVTKKIFTPAV